MKLRTRSFYDVISSWFNSNREFNTPIKRLYPRFLYHKIEFTFKTPGGKISKIVYNSWRHAEYRVTQIFCFVFRNSLLNMAAISFCFILGVRRETAMAGTHLALAFEGGRTQLFTRPHRIGCENNSHRNITMTLSLKQWRSWVLWRTNEIRGFWELRTIPALLGLKNAQTWRVLMLSSWFRALV